MNLTDNEIMKALKCCLINAECDGCPMYDGKSHLENCETRLLRLCADLINRQKAENDDLFYKLEGVMHFVDKWLDGDELKQDEASRAITMRDKTLQIVEKQQAENERLEKLLRKWKKVFIPKDYDPNDDLMFLSVDVKDVNKLLKEMTEQRKEDEGK